LKVRSRRMIASLHPEIAARRPRRFCPERALPGFRRSARVGGAERVQARHLSRPPFLHRRNGRVEECWKGPAPRAIDKDIRANAGATRTRWAKNDEDGFASECCRSCRSSFEVPVLGIATFSKEQLSRLMAEAHPISPAYFGDQNSGSLARVSFET